MVRVRQLVVLYLSTAKQIFFGNIFTSGTGVGLKASQTEAAAAVIQFGGGLESPVLYDEGTGDLDLSRRSCFILRANSF
jgi:hypothetical protein